MTTEQINEIVRENPESLYALDALNRELPNAHNYILSIQGGVIKFKIPGDKIITYIKYSYKKDYNVNNTHCYLYPQMYEQHEEDIKIISKILNDTCPKLHSLGIHDVHAGGVQISGSLDGQYYHLSVTINYQWSDLAEKLKEFINRWNVYINA